MKRLLLAAFVAAAIYPVSSFAQDDEGWATGLYWSSGCLVSHWYYPTHTMRNGSPGPAGYTRYVDIGFVHFCLPV